MSEKLTNFAIITTSLADLISRANGFTILRSRLMEIPHQMGRFSTFSNRLSANKLRYLREQK